MKYKMKCKYLWGMMLMSFFLNAQTYVKINALPALIGMPNVGIETKIGEKQTFQFDILASLWKSVDGYPRQFYIFMPEYRYHFREINGGFYVGANAGFTLFNFQKYTSYGGGQYQKGFGYLLGVTVGYEKKISDHFMLDFFIGGGNNQGFYKGYFIENDERYDHAVHYNKSGEWIPYRGGVMLSYKIN
jgi:hypothetical protein